MRRIIFLHCIFEGCCDTTLSDCGTNLPYKVVCHTKLFLGALQHEAVVLQREGIAVDDLMDETLPGEPYLAISMSGLE